ncbi:MAG: YceI family protein [Thermoleophilia bacterium]|nr:YceI family protein [Thermoleophilia bacterium]
MSTTELTTAVPVGTWTSDPVHSSFGFSVKHMVVATFRGTLADFDATLTATEDGTARLEAAGRVNSVVTPDENLTGHIQSPDFFDAERFPEVRYVSTSITREGDTLVVEGELTLKGTTKPLQLTGSLVGPVVGMAGTEAIGVELEGVIDRTEYGLNWNAPLPTGGFAVGNAVTLTAHLELGKA